MGKHSSNLNKFKRSLGLGSNPVASSSRTQPPPSSQAQSIPRTIVRLFPHHGTPCNDYAYDHERFISPAAIAANFTEKDRLLTLYDEIGRGVEKRYTDDIIPMYEEENRSARPDWGRKSRSGISAGKYRDSIALAESGDFDSHDSILRHVTRQVVESLQLQERGAYSPTRWDIDLCTEHDFGLWKAREQERQPYTFRADAMEGLNSVIADQAMFAKNDPLLVGEAAKGLRTKLADLHNSLGETIRSQKGGEFYNTCQDAIKHNHRGEVIPGYSAFQISEMMNVEDDEAQTRAWLSFEPALLESIANEMKSSCWPESFGDIRYDPTYRQYEVLYHVQE